MTRESFYNNPGPLQSDRGVTLQRESICIVTPAQLRKCILIDIFLVMYIDALNYFMMYSVWSFELFTPTLLSRYSNHSTKDQNDSAVQGTTI